MNEHAQEERVATEGHPYNDATNGHVVQRELANRQSDVWLAKTAINERVT